LRWAVTCNSKTETADQFEAALVIRATRSRLDYGKLKFSNRFAGALPDLELYQNDPRNAEACVCSRELSRLGKEKRTATEHRRSVEK